MCVSVGAHGVCKIDTRPKVSCAMLSWPPTSSKLEVEKYACFVLRDRELVLHAGRLPSPMSSMLNFACNI